MTETGTNSPGTAGPDKQADFRLTRAMRLTHARQYENVYDARLRKSRGPLTIFAATNDLPHPRLGLSIGRKVGNAAVRNRLKRMIREAFRLSRAKLPSRSGGHFDLVVSARAHDAATLGEYQGWLLEAVAAIAREHEKRGPAPRSHAGPHTGPLTGPDPHPDRRERRP
jgi:ribonuclease P protein component